MPFQRSRPFDDQGLRRPPCRVEGPPRRPPVGPHTGLLVLAAWAGWISGSAAQGVLGELALERNPAVCAPRSTGDPEGMPEAARDRHPGSQVQSGMRDIAWAWLGGGTPRYPHASFGTPHHAGELHVWARDPDGRTTPLIYRLPVHRVFEDLNPRVVDLDGDGRDEVVLVESDALRGSAIVVIGVRSLPPIRPQARPGPMELRELARSAPTGTTYRWMNPLGVADFDGDGRVDLAVVSTPHLGGVLNLYRYRPPRLEAFATLPAVSNHRMGSTEQNLGVVWAGRQPGEPPSVVVPDAARRALLWVRWESSSEGGRWVDMSRPLQLPAAIEKLFVAAGQTCLGLANGSSWRVTARRY